ncbi:MAG: DoxX family protein, partial [Polyangiaceae bacterium]|nr:DoxX family protein [Polyangiaceae bacterium]
MVPYVVPFGFLFVLAALRLHPRLAARYTLVDAAAWSLSALLVMTGLAHFIGLREDMIRMVPPLFPRPDLIVTVTGVLELAGAVALLPRRTRNITGIALALLFVAMLPANIYAAQAGLTFGGEPAPPLVIRVPEQLVYIAL